MCKSVTIPLICIISFICGAFASHHYLSAQIQTQNAISTEIQKSYTKLVLQKDYYRTIDAIILEIRQLESLVSADEVGMPRSLQINYKVDHVKRNLDKLEEKIKYIEDEETKKYAQGLYNSGIKTIKEVEFNYSSQ